MHGDELARATGKFWKVPHPEHVEGAARPAFTWLKPTSRFLDSGPAFREFPTSPATLGRLGSLEVRLAQNKRDIKRAPSPVRRRRHRSAPSGHMRFRQWMLRDRVSCSAPSNRNGVAATGIAPNCDVCTTALHSRLARQSPHCSRFTWGAAQGTDASAIAGQMRPTSTSSQARALRQPRLSAAGT
jgi:hypothetical protein